MALTNKEIAVLGVLLCCVPFQMYLTHTFAPVSKHESSVKLQEIIDYYSPTNFKNAAAKWVSSWSLSNLLTYLNKLKQKLFTKGMYFNLHQNISH